MEEMTIKKWYPEYNIFKRAIIYILYRLDPYSKKMPLDCYLYYRFDILNKQEKHEILLDHEIMEYEKKFNDDSVRHIFNDKKEFYSHFKKYMRRKIIFLDDCSFEEFYGFLQENRTIVVKPRNMFGGQGFKIIEYKDVIDKKILEKEFKFYKDSKYIAEEDLVNEESYRRIYDKSLNTVRINTLISKDGKVKIIGFINQFGSSGSITDNDETCGIWSSADIETGIIKHAEKDDETAVCYDVHPDTKANIIGFANKEYKSIKQLALELAKVIPEARLVGWDLAVTDRGIELIEGNVTPELGVLQAMTGIGFRTLFEAEIL